MQKVTLIFSVFLLSSLCLSQVSINNVQIAATTVSYQGTTPSNPNAYTWSEITNTKQGVNISIIPPAKAEICLQLNNSWINYHTLYSDVLMTKLWVKYDGGDYQQIVNSLKQSTGWQFAPYSSTGVHTLSVKWIDDGGTVYFRDYDVFVVPQCTKIYMDNYGNTLTSWEGGNSNRVVLISEGFDTYNVTYSEYLRHKGRSLFDPLIQNGYKIYFLNYQYNSQDMRNSAAIYNSAARFISTLNSNTSMIAAGISMGGVVVRFALAKAESENNPLPFAKFVSIDAPQQGALLAADLQDWMKDNLSDFSVSGLNNDAAKQLLVYNTFDTSGAIRTSFYGELNNLNGGRGYPILTTNVGVSFSSGAVNSGDGRWAVITWSPIFGTYTEIKKSSFLNSQLKTPGSYLPRSIATAESSPALLGMSQVERDPNNDPTFIPYNSSLDIVNGVSKFSTTIQANYNHYHDDFPAEIVSPVLKSIMAPFSVVVQNSFVGGGHDGVVYVNGVQYNSPKQLTLYPVDTITISTTNQSVNSIYYTFSGWSDGVTQSSRQICFSTASTISAGFSGKPEFGNRTLHFNASDPDEPITILWNEHPNTNVTQYKIWRKLKYNKGTTGEAMLVGTVNRGTTSIVDESFYGTNLGYTKWMLFYDVKAYYAPEGTYSDNDYISVFSNGFIPKISNTKNDTSTVFCEKTDAYPNPFNPTTNIYFELSKPADVSIKIYNSLGREVTTLLNEPRDAGRHQVIFNGTGLPSGVYFYVIRAGQFSDSKKLMLIK